MTLDAGLVARRPLVRVPASPSSLVGICGQQGGLEEGGRGEHTLKAGSRAWIAWQAGCLKVFLVCVTVYTTGSLNMVSESASDAPGMRR